VTILARFAPELAALGGWLMTLLVHSALCCAAALAAGRWLVRDPHSRDRLWKLALLAPIVTATFATIGAARYPGRAFSAAPIISIAPGGGRVDLNVKRTSVNGVETVTTERSNLDGLFLIAVFSVIVMGAGSFSVLRFATRRVRAARAIAGRKILARESDDWSSVPQFVARRPLRISLSSEITSPVALSGTEICLPTGTFSQLTSSQRHSILRHEVSHLERRDPEWILLGQLIANAMVAQPLARLVVEQMRRDAEFICDDEAVSRHASPRALAESLAILARPFDSLASALGSHYSSSPIVERAERLLGQSDTFGRRSRQARRIWTTVAATFACATLAASPALTLSASEPLSEGALPLSIRPMIVTDEKDLFLTSPSLPIRR